MSANLTEIVPDCLFAIGGWLERPGRPVSWIADTATGFLPVQGYALRSRGHWLLVDTGLPIHYAAIAAGIRETAAGCHDLRMINTRREPDCMINIPAILRDFPIRDVLYAGALNPLDFFDDVEEADMAARLASAGAVATTKIQDGLVTPIGDLRLEVLRTELRLLSTNWFYEQVTQTLFSSDAFAFITRAEPGSHVSPAQTFDVAAIAAFLGAKMDWLRGIDPAPILADLDALQRSRPIARICPSFGCTIEGESAVAHAFDATRGALRLLAGMKRVPGLGDFRWHGTERVHGLTAG